MTEPLDPYSPASLADPVPFWARLRAEAPIFEVPGSPGLFLVSRYEDVRRVCNAPELYSSEVGVIAQLGPDGRPRLERAVSSGTPHGRVLGAADGEIHDRHRRLLARTLGAREMKRFEHWVRARAETLVRAAPSACDAMEALAGPLPVQAMLHLLGLPAEDWRRLWAWSGPVMLLMGGRLDAETTARYVAESEALQAYLAPFVDPKSEQAAALADEGIAARLRDAAASGEIADWEARGLLLQLVVGGSETTVGLIGAAIRRLAEDPELFARLRTDPDRVGPFVEETNRLDGPAVASYRHTTRATGLGGVALPADATVAILWGSANRDERAFGDPDRFDLDRPNLKAHIAFGHGAHFCLGAALARIEAKAMVDALLADGRSIARARPEEPIELAPSLTIRRIERLPIRLAP
ncbi:MAG: cytochrome P450 [Myxococcota bacterium]